MCAITVLRLPSETNILAGGLSSIIHPTVSWVVLVFQEWLGPYKNEALLQSSIFAL